MPKWRTMSPENLIYGKNFKNTTRQDSYGRYIVTIPFKMDFPNQLPLGSSKRNELSQFISNNASLLRKPLIKKNICRR